MIFVTAVTSISKQYVRTYSNQIQESPHGFAMFSTYLEEQAL